MRNKFTFIALFSMIFAWGCTDVELDDIKTLDMQSRSLTVSASAVEGMDSRVAITEDGDVWVTSWVGDEEIFGQDYVSGYFNTMYFDGHKSDDCKEAAFSCDDFQYDASSGQVRFIYPGYVATENGTFYIDFTEQEYDVTQGSDENKAWIAENTMYLMSDYVSYSDIDAGNSYANLKHLSSIVALSITPANFDSSKSYTISRIEVDAPGAYGKYSIGATQTSTSDNIYNAPYDVNPSVVLPDNTIDAATEVLISMPPFTVTNGSDISIIVTMNDGTSEFDCVATKTNTSGADLSFDAALYHTLTFELDLADVSGNSDDPTAATLADNTTFSIYSCSSEETIAESPSGFASCLIDGSLSTYWHSAWLFGITSPPFEIVIALNNTYTIASVHLSPKAVGYYNSGTIYTSYDGSTWIEQADFEVGAESESAIAMTTSISSRYAKLSVSSQAGCLSEFNISYKVQS